MPGKIWEDHILTINQSINQSPDLSVASPGVAPRTVSPPASQFARPADARSIAEGGGMRKTSTRTAHPEEYNTSINLKPD